MHRRHRHACGRRDGCARGSRGRDSAGRCAWNAEGTGSSLSSGQQAGRRRDADARIDDPDSIADASGSVRRGNRDYDSADAVMLSAESASGQFPVEAVAMMDRIISHTEGHKLYRSIIDALQPAPEDSIPHAVAGAAAIVAFTASGTTALRVARKRPKVPIVSLSPEAGTARQLALLWGAHSMVAEDIASYDEMVDRARTQVLRAL